MKRNVNMWLADIMHMVHRTNVYGRRKWAYKIYFQRWYGKDETYLFRKMLFRWEKWNAQPVCCLIYIKSSHFKHFDRSICPFTLFWYLFQWFQWLRRTKAPIWTNYVQSIFYTYSGTCQYNGLNDILVSMYLTSRKALKPFMPDRLQRSSAVNRLQFKHAIVLSIAFSQK